jgi:hypothetical protein
MSSLSNLQLFPPKTTVSLGEAVALGKIAGARPVTLYGYNADIDTTAWEDLDTIGGTQVLQDTAAEVEIIAGGNAGDAHDGAGAKTFRLVYVDGSYVEQTLTMDLQGAAAVPTVVTNVLRVNDFRIMTGTPIAAVTLGKHADATPLLTVSAGEFYAKQACYTVPYGYKYVIDSISVSGTNGSAATKNFLKFQLVANYDEYTQAKAVQEFVFAELSVDVGGSALKPTVPFTFPAGVTARVRVTGDALTDNVVASAVVNGYIVPV